MTVVCADSFLKPVHKYIDKYCGHDCGLCRYFLWDVYASKYTNVVDMTVVCARFLLWNQKANKWPNTVNMTAFCADYILKLIHNYIDKNCGHDCGLCRYFLWDVYASKYTNVVYMTVICARLLFHSNNLAQMTVACARFLLWNLKDSKLANAVSMTVLCR